MLHLDKDYLKRINSDYKAGYEHGRVSMMKEVIICLAIAAFVIWYAT